MFRIHMLPAEHGDSLWVEYGEAAPPHRILIDCGTVGTYTRALRSKIREVVAAEGKCRFELFVVTHVDADHIGGALAFLGEADALGVEIGHIWFNGYFHLSDQKPGLLGPDQGERLSALIEDGKWQWNAQFGKRAVAVPDAGALPQHEIEGMKLTLLSPTLEKLRKLKPVWEKVIREAGLTPGDAYTVETEELPEGFLGTDVKALAARPFKQDRAEANGSSIAFLAEYDGRRVLFAADAHPDALLAALSRKPLERETLHLDAFKLPHHASKNNVSQALIAAYPAEHYLISTNGNQFKHPDAEAIARILLPASDTPRQLHFNYDTAFNSDWRSKSLTRKWRYKANYGTEEEGLMLEL